MIPYNHIHIYHIQISNFVWVAIINDFVSHFIFPLSCVIQVFFCVISCVSLLKYLDSCFTFLLLVLELIILILLFGLVVFMLFKLLATKSNLCHFLYYLNYCIAAFIRSKILPSHHNLSVVRLCASLSI